MTLLYYLALYFTASKVITYLDAFTPTSLRRVDLLAFLVIGFVMVGLSLGVGALI